MSGESQNTHGRRKTPTICRGLGKLCIKKGKKQKSRLPCEEVIIHYENLRLFHQRKF